MTSAGPLLCGCGILQAEVRFLVGKHGWPLDLRFFDPVLHCDLQRLETALSGTLRQDPERPTVVFYGVCHPLMDRIVADHRAVRTEGQNCVEMLLGHERFTAALADGAYFLLEEWARDWGEMMARTFGNVRVAREIFHGDRTHLLAIRTPCSRPFDAEAAAAAEMVGVPVRWTDVTLDHLESVLATAVAPMMEVRR
jgi:hypothetical protein